MQIPDRGRVKSNISHTTGTLPVFVQSLTTLSDNSGIHVRFAETFACEILDQASANVCKFEKFWRPCNAYVLRIDTIGVCVAAKGRGNERVDMMCSETMSLAMLVMSCMSFQACCADCNFSPGLFNVVGMYVAHSIL